MAQAVTFCPGFVWGPSAHLLFEAQRLNANTVGQICDELSAVVSKQGLKLEGKDEFLAQVKDGQTSVQEVLGSKMFQHIVKDADTTQVTAEKLNGVAKATINESTKHFKVQLSDSDAPKVQKWYEKAFVVFLPKEHIEAYSCGEGDVNAALIEERKQIGKDMFALAKDKKVTQEGMLDAFKQIETLFASLKTQNPEELALVGRYVSLMTKADDPNRLCTDIIGLVRNAKDKIFPQEQ